MKFFYAIVILIQSVIALLFRNESKAAYLLYLWSDLSGHELQAGSHSITSPGVPKENETKFPVSDREYSLFLEP